MRDNSHGPSLAVVGAASYSNGMVMGGGLRGSERMGVVAVLAIGPGERVKAVVVDGCGCGRRYSVIARKIRGVLHRV